MGHQNGISAQMCDERWSVLGMPGCATLDACELRCWNAAGATDVHGAGANEPLGSNSKMSEERASRGSIDYVENAGRCQHTG